MEPTTALNFEDCSYKASEGGRSYRAFNMTRDGFTLLAFGFTGKKALGFKLQYIQQFNVMEEMLKAPVKEQSLLTTSNALSTFNFNSNEIRVVTIDDQPWFVAADVCKALDYYIGAHGRPNVTVPLRSLNSNQIGLYQIQTKARGGKVRQQEVKVISEGGLNRLVMRSDKPEARPFQDWITDVVIPAIRKDGAYIMGEEKVASGEMDEEEFLAKALLIAQRKVERYRAHNEMHHPI